MGIGAGMATELRDERERGWFHIDNAVIDEYLPRIGVPAFSVYACIVRHADRHGVAFPSYTKLQQLLGTGRAQIASAIKKIVEAGLVWIESGKRGQNIYHIVTVTTSAVAELVSNRNEFRSETAQSPDQFRRETSTGSAEKPKLVPERNPNKTQLTRPKEQEGEGEARGRASPFAADGVLMAIPPDFSPGEAERQQMVALSIPRDWYQAKWWSIVEHYEGKPDERRTEESWRRTCRRLISEDWAKALAGRAPPHRKRSCPARCRARPAATRGASSGTTCP
jgi:hypothetical protein